MATGTQYDFGFQDLDLLFGNPTAQQQQQPAPYRPLTNGARPTSSNPANWRGADDLAQLAQMGEDRFNMMRDAGVFGGIRQSPYNRGGSQNPGLDYLRTPEQVAANIASRQAGMYGANQRQPQFEPSPFDFGFMQQPEIDLSPQLFSEDVSSYLPTQMPTPAPTQSPVQRLTEQVVNEAMQPRPQQGQAPSQRPSPAPQTDTPMADTVLGVDRPQKDQGVWLNDRNQAMADIEYAQDSGEDMQPIADRALKAGYITPDEYKDLINLAGPAEPTATPPQDIPMPPIYGPPYQQPANREGMFPWVANKIINQQADAQERILNLLFGDTNIPERRRAENQQMLDSFLNWIHSR